MSEDDILLRVYRKYSDEENFKFIVRKCKERGVLIGSLISETHELKHEILKLKHEIRKLNIIKNENPVIQKTNENPVNKDSKRDYDHNYISISIEDIQSTNERETLIGYLLEIQVARKLHKKTWLTGEMELAIAAKLNSIKDVKNKDHNHIIERGLIDAFKEKFPDIFNEVFQEIKSNIKNNNLNPAG